MKNRSSHFIIALLTLTILSLHIQAIDITINTQSSLTPISPFIYGTNQDLNNGENYTMHRHGGNRWTGYNWENNASNAGIDWHNQSDSYLGGGTTPAGAIINRHDSDITNGYASLITIPMAGYVAADKNGPVDTITEVAPSNRWDTLIYTKPSPLSSTPDLSDGQVFTDELVYTLVEKYGISNTSQGILGYLLDNEPGLWSSTHPALHPTPVTSLELAQKSVSLATSIKQIDSTALTFGPVFYGFSGMYDMQGATDWDSEKGTHSWYVSYYLEKFKTASDTYGKPLLNVLDLHWYSEAKGDQRITNKTATSIADQKERVQAPRTLWDPTYSTDTHHEDSWIGKWMYTYLPLIPTIQRDIDTYNPGTKISLTEWNFGGESDITGAIATADFLGSMGALGVYAASYWKMWDTTSYTSVGFRLFRNYDGNNATFGELSIPTTSSNTDSVTAYTAQTNDTDLTLHTILINKDANDSAIITLIIESDTNYSQAEVWQVDNSQAKIIKKTNISTETKNQFAITLEPFSIVHLVISPETASPILHKQANYNLPILALSKGPSLGYTINLTSSAQAIINLVDVRGRIVTQLYAGKLNTGRYTQHFPTGISSGMYLISATIDNQIYSQQICIP